MEDETPYFVNAFQDGVLDLFVPPGTYVINSLQMPDNARVHGAGRASVLKLAQGADNILLLGNGCTVTDLALDGGGVGKDFTAGLVKCVSKSDIALERLSISNTGYTGILTDHGERVRISNCAFSKVYRAVSLVFSNGVQVSGNTVTDCAEHGIVWWGNWKGEAKLSRDIIISGNYVRYGGAGAIWGTGAARVSIVGNIVATAKDVGIDAEWCDDITVSGNVVADAANAGISLFYACTNASICGNTVVIPDAAEGLLRGIWLTDPNRKEMPDDHGHRNVAIFGNTITALDGEKSGIYIGAESENVHLQANVLSNCTVVDNR